jgi:serine/threonine-protein kinase
MKPDPATEARLFGKLAMRGVLPREAVGELFAAAKAAAAAGQPVALSSLALRRGLIEKERLLLYFHTDGDDVPALPGYEYVSKLGEGGTARVYQVRHVADGQAEALKILHAELAARPEAVKAFLGEAALLKRLAHENVVQGHKAGRFGEHFLFFMEYVDGRTLQDMIVQGGAFDEDGALFVILQVARALEYLREQGLVHRDIKPGNLMLCRCGGIPDTVKVVDFGIVKGPGEGAAEGLLGTPAYMAPEAVRGEPVDARADLYGLGATAYYLLTGTDVFRGRTVGELLEQQLHAAPEPPSVRAGRALPADLERLVLACLEKLPDARPASAAVLGAELAACADAGEWTRVDAEAWWREHPAVREQLPHGLGPAAERRRSLEVDIDARSSGTASGPV